MAAYTLAKLLQEDCDFVPEIRRTKIMALRHVHSAMRKYHQYQCDLCCSTLTVVHTAKSIIELREPSLSGWPVKKAIGWHCEIEVAVEELLGELSWNHHTEIQVGIYGCERCISEGENAVGLRER